MSKSFAVCMTSGTDIAKEYGIISLFDDSFVILFDVSSIFKSYACVASFICVVLSFFVVI